ncbi:hypothetical protein VTK73DRAFT_1506 [Phialemonium thermophilum]|uniref:Uncharacterized protein n=1 Tax=Phialemonium thermophilum TaxID=223376 RepID=A0ABR3VTB0_9PEZI
MEKRTWRGFSRGKMPARLGCRYSSARRARSLAMPMFSATSWKRILRKMRLAEVVSSSLRCTTDSTCQPMASLASRWANRRAMLRSLLVGPQAVDAAHALGDEPVELDVGLGLGARLHHHGHQLGLLARRQAQLEQLVGGLFGVGAALQGQVDGAAQVDQVGVGLVLDLEGLFLFVLVLVVVLVVVVFRIGRGRGSRSVVAALAQDGVLQLAVGLLVLLPALVVAEDVEGLLAVDVGVERDLVGDLVLLLDQVQLLAHGRVVLEAVAAHLEQHLDHVLHAAVDVGLVQDGAELVEDEAGHLRVHVLEVLAHLAGQADGDLDAVVGGALQQQHQHLGGQGLVHDLLVDQVGDEGGGGQAHGLVVAAEGLAEAQHQALDQQLADLGQLGVDDGGGGGVDGGEGQAGGLGLGQALAEQAAAAHQVLGEQLRHDGLDVGDVDLVDEAVDALLEGLPSHALVLAAGLVGDLGLQGAQAGGRDVGAAAAHVEQALVLGLGGGLLLLLGARGRGGRRRLGAGSGSSWWW